MALGNLLATGYINVANARCVVHAVAVGTSPVLALAGATRSAIFFHNPALSGPSVWIFQALAPGSTGIQALAAGAPGTFRIDPGVGFDVNPCASGAWYAVSNAAGAALTVMEF